ncbi:MAG: VCBS repeat-containing protein [Candidatus Fermentibacter sp.]|nr:VCBS repeat-containing protein [Candidatus Fermentibacter sp.]
MGRLSSLAFTLLAAAAAPGATLAQTEWTGSGVPGPAREFGSGFASAEGVDWLGSPGALTLDRDPLVHGVDVIQGGISSLAAADMDGDGDCDLAACAFRGRIVLYENTGGGLTFVVHPLYTPEAFGPERIVASDIDRDGDTDIAGTSRGDGTLAWWENAGGLPWIRHDLDPGAGTPFPLDAGDIDGDGSDEILAGLEMPGRLVIMDRDAADAGWTAIEVDGDLPAPQWVEILPDGGLLASSFSDSTVYLYSMDGDGWDRTAVARARGPLCAIPADMDGDGGRDLVFCSAWEDTVFWKPLAEGGASTVISTLTMAPGGLAAADVDGDGDTDAVVSSESAGEVAWFANCGDGSRFAPHYAAQIAGCSCVSAGDLDGDGLPDAAAGSIDDGSLIWATLGEYGETGSLTSSIVHLGPDPAFASLSWEGDAPPGTSVRLSVRISADRTRMGSWTEVSGRDADISHLLSDGAVFLQYRIELASTSRNATPTVESVTLRTGSAFSL